ncbi:hypothetical protein ACKWTF_016276 [Chironomus riparius]
MENKKYIKNILLSPEDVDASLFSVGDPPVYRLLYSNHAAIDGLVPYNDNLKRKIIAMSNGLYTDIKLTEGFRIVSKNSRCYFTCPVVGHKDGKHVVYFVNTDLKPGSELMLNWHVKCCMCRDIFFKVPKLHEQEKETISKESSTKTPSEKFIGEPGRSIDMIKSSREAQLDQNILKQFFDNVEANVISVLHESYSYCSTVKNPMAEVRNLRSEICLNIVFAFTDVLDKMQPVSVSQSTQTDVVKEIKHKLVKNDPNQLSGRAALTLQQAQKNQMNYLLEQEEIDEERRIQLIEVQKEGERYRHDRETKRKEEAKDKENENDEDKDEANDKDKEEANDKDKEEASYRHDRETKRKEEANDKENENDKDKDEANNKDKEEAEVQKEGERYRHDRETKRKEEANDEKNKKDKDKDEAYDEKNENDKAKDEAKDKENENDKDLDEANNKDKEEAKDKENENDKDKDEANNKDKEEAEVQKEGERYRHDRETKRKEEANYEKNKKDKDKDEANDMVETKDKEEVKNKGNEKGNYEVEAENKEKKKAEINEINENRNYCENEKELINRNADVEETEKFKNKKINGGKHKEKEKKALTKEVGRKGRKRGPTTNPQNNIMDKYLKQ